MLVITVIFYGAQFVKNRRMVMTMTIQKKIFNVGIAELGL
jgi:uncharacterized protein YlxP (DUF503 family)